MTYTHERQGPSRTTVWALGWQGEYAGRLLVAWPRDGAGRVYAGIQAWAGPLGCHEGDGRDTPIEGWAGGYGYDKLSGAVVNALNKAGIAHTLTSGGGRAQVRAWLEGLGYIVWEAL